MSRTLQKYLNELLQTEIASFLEYSLRSASCGDPCMERELAAFALEEAEHIRQLMSLIMRNGGEVTTSAPQGFPADSLDDFLERSLAREDDAIRRFTALLPLLPTEGDRMTLQSSIDQEAQHREHIERLRVSCRFDSARS
ncbi:ferritin-like domain-containing protein [Fundidesulfovibrio soli]|uniref:ferritin-like domain-containing protein n=1 Tax=Fundidesulfovibrio soli TaxID=2922716 RepID=UPI001FAF34B2|nr:ferritin-like domain-containing protein [Fundidesulfovibrio soli]